MGLAVREASGGLTRAWEQADRRMYAQKRTQWPLSLSVQPSTQHADRPAPQGSARQSVVDDARRPRRD